MNGAPNGAQKGRREMKLSNAYGNRFSATCEDKHVEPYSWIRFIHDIDRFVRLNLIETNDNERTDMRDDYIIRIKEKALYNRDFARFMRCVDRAIYHIYFDNSVIITHNAEKTETVRVTFIWE